ncbi:hypothetical protein [Methylibium sp. Root1272]|uniref:hypothetical protein n=1 Tax=Methylibium sp. Root1272 TaxID=1736441 RepID=UPI0012E8BEEF|nr:hypothetical protein [Methylibium sp. Root1272]|eukprot:TRINITY_DN18431_c0_g1_i1.p2 TRINITY_DN18431_c0_g1~~TRINITY_DN18431_c0_g1_i1.p2  ORF type:complete len:162 (-),score=43.59 TRINITY_DN18431_c0_g1_i1:56-541(-)
MPSVSAEQRDALARPQRAGPPRSFDEFEQRLPCIAGRVPLAPADWTGRRAATLARRAGACDHLITAALVHDFARYFDGREEACVARRSADLLVAVFPEPVLEPMRCLDGRPSDPGAAPAPRAVTQGRRLRAYIDSASTCSDDLLLPWQTLLGIARRASFDG